MTRKGEYSRHRRDGRHVVKLLHIDHMTGMGIAVAAQHAGTRGLRGYLDTLTATGVPLPADLDVVSENPLAVRHQWVSGPTLDDLSSVPLDAFTASIVRIAGWVRALEDTDARIDTNLANFCLREPEGELVLIDVLPPLVPSRRPQPHNSYDTLLNALCFDTQVTLDALAGYATRAVLREATATSARQFLPVAREVATFPQRAEVSGFPESWFRARAHLALRALEDDQMARELHEFFTLTSMLAFRELDEPTRLRRIAQVHRRIEEWNLL